MFSHHDLTTANDAQYDGYINTQPRECMLYAAARATVEQVARAADKYPREAIVHATDKLAQTPETFKLAVYKQPTVALIYAIDHLSPEQIVSFSDQAPSIAVTYAHNYLPKERLWVYIQTAPEMAVISINNILMVTDVSMLNEQLKATNIANSYTTSVPMIDQPNPYGLPQKTMLDELIIYSLTQNTTTLARLILVNTPPEYYTDNQEDLLREKITQTKFPYTDGSLYHPSW